MPTLTDLGTVLYRPRETMRSVLAEKDRWAVQIVVLAYISASIKDGDARQLNMVMPGLGWSSLAVIVLALIFGAIVWVIGLYLVSWIVAIVGRRMGGVAGTPDVRAALAWGLVPVIWAAILWIPFAIARSRLRLSPGSDSTTAVLDFIAQGGCSLLVVLLTLQVVIFAWCVWVASCCLGEAQQFTTGKGFANIAVVLALPLVIALAVIASQHLHF